ncbi:hypothetical protein ABG79_02163 [Caloramator mitchellensis]|uniref:Uncharacterized protein n=2 Tax=Caloramator mitchellensis TaxID=908809 RepID=A0A0R3K179_CALMK|nr:hypothetical protein ABG79_02163 [Caloramator mitchellensis]
MFQKNKTLKGRDILNILKIKSPTLDDLINELRKLGAEIELRYVYDRKWIIKVYEMKRGIKRPIIIENSSVGRPKQCKDIYSELKKLKGKGIAKNDLLDIAIECNYIGTVKELLILAQQYKIKVVGR